MTDECRDVLAAVKPSDARALLAVYQSAEDAAHALRDALAAADLSIIASVGRDGAPCVVVVGGGDTHEVVVMLPVGVVEAVVRLRTRIRKGQPPAEKAA
ncbi:hypothetical protein F1D05_14370 [Kribbella qitaiheensis]|uniref:Uncharacterized protein n=1 Tax=Kribbella qitaiheensis TaxID=1544730 RepID=A0A7G6WY11_9ACTN|nr:hypothetical protein [Kribbella qitaiheensis]QNE18876.1 hypothetical protein F1D05_14370 [Kribbella qitaiheensis]